MMTQAVPISPLHLNPLTRDLWGSFDASAIAQLAPLASDPCYSIKFYKAPADNQELLAPNAYAAYGLKVSPGSIIFGFYLPVDSQSLLPPLFTVQITDVDLEHKWFTEPIASLFLANSKFTFMTPAGAPAGSFPNLLTAPHPVTGRGFLKVDIQNQNAEQQRVELVLGVFEVCDAG